MSNITNITISTAAIGLNIVSLTGTIFMGFMCTFMLIILLPPIIRTYDVVLILAANNYLALLVFSLVAVGNNIDIVRADYHLFLGTETYSCRLKGYSIYSLLAVIFNTFSLQVKF